MLDILDLWGRVGETGLGGGERKRLSRPQHPHARGAPGTVSSLLGGLPQIPGSSARDRPWPAWQPTLPRASLVGSNFVKEAAGAAPCPNGKLNSLLPNPRI